MYSWGAGTNGQLGTGRLQDAVAPEPVLWDQEAPFAIACGGNHVLAITGTAAWFWGLARSVGAPHVHEASYISDTAGQAQQIPPSLFAAAVVSCVSAGWSHTAFVTGDGRLWMAGDGAFGQLGLGTSVTHAAKPVQLQGILASHQVSQVTCGMHHTLALAWPRSQTADPGNTSQSKQIQDQGMLAILGSHAQNTVFGFGANRKGQCGVVSQAQHGVGAGNIWEPNVGNISAGQQIVEVIAGGHHSAALDQEGCLYLWGRTFTAYPHAHAPFTAQPPETCQQAFAVQAQRHAATLTTAQPSICRWKQVP